MGKRPVHWDVMAKAFRFGRSKKSAEVLREILANAEYRTGYFSGVRTLADMSAEERKALEEKYRAKIAESVK